jgi:sugar diacid utilization regulator
MKLLAGQKGLDNVVRWVHIIEDIEIPNFLHGNELVFTTGMAQTFKKNWLMDFINAMLEKKISGLVINIGPYVKEVPEDIIDYCEKHDLPLYSVPWSVRVIDITYDFCHKIIAGNEAEIGLSSAFRNLIFAPNEEESYRSTLERYCFYANGSYRVIEFELIPSAKEINLNEEAQNTLRLTAQKILLELQSKESFSLFFQDKRLIVALQDCTKQQAEKFVATLQAEVDGQKIGCTLTAGISAEGVGYHFVADAYQKAIMALRIAKQKNLSVLNYQDMGVYQLLVSVTDKTVLRELYEGSLGILENFDRNNKTDYMQTLRYYLDYDSSVQEVAKLTFVHRNTVNYKIKKIREILNCEFVAETKLKLMLAFLIKDLL